MINRILSHYGYVRRDSRVWEADATDMKDTDALARANRWIAFYNEKGGLRDMITELRRGYFEKVGQLQPDDVAGLRALGMADRIVREIDGQVKQIIDAGQIAKMQQEHADNIAQLSDAKRRRI